MKGPQKICEPAGSHGRGLALLVFPMQRVLKQRDPVNNEIKIMSKNIPNLTLNIRKSGPSLLKLLNLEIVDDVNKNKVL